jgi:hypothetical protein
LVKRHFHRTYYSGRKKEILERLEMSDGEKLIKKLIALGVEFPEGIIPSRWHYRKSGCDLPRTVLCYERVVAYRTIRMQASEVKWNNRFYSELITMDKIKELIKGEIVFEEWDFNQLIISRINS